MSNELLLALSSTQATPNSRHTRNACHHHPPALWEKPYALLPHSPLEYNPQKARHFTESEIANRMHHVNQKTKVACIIEHPLDAVVEYPETGSKTGESIAHVFAVDPDRFYNPKDNIQYSLGGTHGSSENVKCWIIPGCDVENPAVCYKLQTQCMGSKICSFNPQLGANELVHSYTTPSMQRQNNIFLATESRDTSASREVAEKTLGFFAALCTYGCQAAMQVKATSCSNEVSLGDSGDSLAEESDSDSAEEDNQFDSRNKFLSSRSSTQRGGNQKCMGKIIVKKDATSQSLLCCENFRNGEQTDHLWRRNLADVDIKYLTALIEDNKSFIATHEEEMRTKGYGPLIPCQFTADAREQKEFCDYWHRNNDGKLERGRMISIQPCPAKFSFYIPYDLEQHPFSVLVTTNPHSHPPPKRSKTPRVYEDIFRALLVEEHWRIADATPRRLQRSESFVRSLRAQLKWEGLRNPVLSDLHPSLGNDNRVAYLINQVKEIHFPDGTDWEGVKDLLDEHQQLLEQNDQYIRRIEELDLGEPGGKAIRIIVCMFQQQSALLVGMKWPAFDTSFKRVKNWMEFAIVYWDQKSKRCITVCRAFVTSQSARAHLHLFRAINAVVYNDTGRYIKFRHIHGDGIEVVTLDEHKGQALGLGQFLVEVAQRHINETDANISPGLCVLGPYEHLAQCLRLCIVHFFRNLKKLEGKVTKEAYRAMQSLASAEPVKNFEETKRTILSGGKKAIDWWNDKESGSPFAIPALYQPASKIPSDIWLAGQSNTNGIEQAHHNINLEGKGLTLLGGIMVGLQFDACALSRHISTIENAMSNRYRNATHYMKAERALKAQNRSRKRVRELQTATSTSIISESSSTKKAKAAPTQSDSLGAVGSSVRHCQGLPSYLRAEHLRLRKTQSPCTTSPSHPINNPSSSENSVSPSFTAPAHGNQYHSQMTTSDRSPQPQGPPQTAQALMSMPMMQPLPPLPPIVIPPGYMLAYTHVLTPILVPLAVTNHTATKQDKEIEK
ncbi:hypothetical protein FRC02_008453 [Tulasnella sp. 418]|nr:hypothetical protein FRC02_008453 [Tulasnella sp. 418]